MNQIEKEDLIVNITISVFLLLLFAPAIAKLIQMLYGN